MMNIPNTLNTMTTPLRRLAAVLGLAGSLALASSAIAQTYSMFPKDALPMIQRSVLPQDTEGKMGGIGYDPTSQCMYFAGRGSNVLHVLDPMGMNTLQSIKDVNEPNGIAVANDLRLLFLTCGDGSVKFYKINESSGPAPVPGTQPPPGFQPAGKLTEVKSLSVPGEADAVRYHAKTKRLFVAHGKFVSWIDVSTFGTPVAAASDSAAAAANPADAWWAKIGAQASNLNRLAQEKAPPEHIREAIQAMTQHAAKDPVAKPADAAAAAAGGGAAKFERLDLGAPVKGIAVSPDGTKLFANVPSQTKVAVIDTATWKVETSWNLDVNGNYPIATDETGKFVFVGCRQPSAVLVLDANSGKELHRLAITNDDANEMWWDSRGRRIYVSSGNGNGTVSMIREQNGNWSTEHNIPTAPGARTSVLIPEKNRYIVVAPKLTYPPFVFIYLIPGPNEHHDYIPAEH